MLDRLKQAGRLKELEDVERVDEHGEEIELFERYEFPVMMEILTIFADGNKCYGAFHLMTMHDWLTTPGRSGWTPMEVAHELYQSLEGRESYNATAIENCYTYCEANGKL